MLIAYLKYLRKNGRISKCKQSSRKTSNDSYEKFQLAKIIIRVDKKHFIYDIIIMKRCFFIYCELFVIYYCEYYMLYHPSEGSVNRFFRHYLIVEKINYITHFNMKNDCEFSFKSIFKLPEQKQLIEKGCRRLVWDSPHEYPVTAARRRTNKRRGGSGGTFAWDNGAKSRPRRYRLCSCLGLPSK